MSKRIEERGYRNTDVLVSTDWVQQHLQDPGVRIAESNEDPILYGADHIPGAVEIDWTRDLNDPVWRDYLDHSGFERLMRRIGVTQETTIVLYGDKNNWWATYAFWVLQLFGHTRARIMDGGRLKLPANMPLSVLAVELFNRESLVVRDADEGQSSSVPRSLSVAPFDPLGSDLDSQRILRVSPLTPAREVCCASTCIDCCPCGKM